MHFAQIGTLVGGGVYVVCLVFCVVSVISGAGWGGVRIPRACGYQCIHAQTVVTFVFQEHTVTSATMPTKSWQAMVKRQKSANLESFHVSHAKDEFARKVKHHKVPQCVVAGTQGIDRFWQTLEEHVPQALHSKEAPGKGVSPTLLDYLHSLLWWYNLPEDVTMMKALEASC